jgi:hypothetical protein
MITRQRRMAGVRSTWPCGSTALTWNRCLPNPTFFL